MDLKDLPSQQHLRLKLQIRSAVSQSQFHLKLDCTGVFEVPCAFCDMMASDPGTQGELQEDDDDDEDRTLRKTWPPVKMAAKAKANLESISKACFIDMRI